jgi:hypothetical protein
VRDKVTGAYMCRLAEGALTLLPVDGLWRLVVVVTGNDGAADFLDDGPAELAAQVRHAELVAAIAGDTLADKRATWRKQPPTSKQLGRLEADDAQRAHVERWTRGRVSDALTVAGVRPLLLPLLDELANEATKTKAAAR